MTRSMTVRADEVQPGDLAALVGWVVEVERVERYSQRRTMITWRKQGMIPAANTLLPHAQPVKIERKV